MKLSASSAEAATSMPRVGLIRAPYAAANYAARMHKVFTMSVAAVYVNVQPPSRVGGKSITVYNETAEGVANVDAIAATPGVGALFIGPADLANSMGVPGNSPEPPHFSFPRPYPNRERRSQP